MTVAELQAMSVEDALTAAWNIVKTNFGTVPYSGTLETTFRHLYRSRTTWFRGTMSQAQLNYLLGTLLPYVGQYAAAHPNLSGTITADEYAAAFEAGQVKSYNDGGGIVSNLC